MRMVEIASGKVPPDPLSPSTGNALATLTGILISVVGHIGFIGIIMERSRRKEIELVKRRVQLEENLRLGEKIAQLDRQRGLAEMSASIGHEINQPLTAILSTTELAQCVLAENSFSKTRLASLHDKIIYNTRRVSQIVEHIRGFARPMETHHEPVDLRAVVGEAIGLLEDDAKTQCVKIVFRSPGHPLIVKGDPIQLSLIVINVLRNAIDALAHVSRREIHVTLSGNNKHLTLSIHDTGLGIATAILAKVGTPFFTTKPTGMGVGLSISRAMCEQHGGVMSIRNAATGGALVEIDLPAL